MKKITITILFSLILLISCSAGETKNIVSGTLKNGLRVLDLDNKSDLNLTVYRGDYIVINISGNISTSFIIPDLDINENLPKDKSEKPYIKIKKSGVYNFTLGDRSGVIKVLELTANNYKELSAKEALKVISNINPVLIDVRTTGEYESGHINNASLLPVQILSSNLDKLEKFKDEPILLYCQSGNRSTVAAKILIDNGFTNVYNLRYGIGDWKREGLPVNK